MAQRLTQNSFEGGLNTDVSKSKLNPTFYTEAHNVDSVADGDFFALKNIKGTFLSQVITSVAGTEVLAVFANNYLIGGATKKCLTIFTAIASTNFKIWCYDTESVQLYELYQETIGTDYLTSSRVVDAVAYAENNIDHLYFTDDYNEIRYLRCEVPSPYVANFLTASDLSVQRRGANGKITLDSILTGGSLLSGSYQFAYRMVDPVNKRFTKWSSLTLPIHVYSAANSTVAAVYSDYGLPTDFKIRIDITPTTEELNNWDYFQLAVIENVYPTGPETVTEGKNQTFVASLLPIETNSTYLSGSVLQNYEHKTNAKVGIIPIEELVVDLAAIKNVKTLSVKGKKLVAANIDYHSLEFDNGTPAAGGSVITRTSAALDLFSSHEESIYRGYFRDEVYRFGIVYIDKFGNRSPVKVLDLNMITNNKISGLLPDVRFPSRSTSNSWTLFDASSRLRSLGLQLTNIRNHPKWAVGFEIVRAKRIKKVLSQTPVIPMTYVKGIGALDGYPSLVATMIDKSGDTQYLSAQPQTTDEIYIPKNLFWPDERVVNRSSSTTTHLKTGEAKLERSTRNTPLAMIFPQNFMYGDGVFVLTGAEELEVVDYAALKSEITNYTAGTAGDTLETKIKANFHALKKGDYYFDPAWVSKSIVGDTHTIKGHKTFENLGTPASLNGKNIMDHEALLTKGIDFGFKPNIQKSVVIDVPTAAHDLMPTAAKVFADAGTKNATADGVAIFSSNGSLVYQNSSSINNNYINTYSGYSDGNSYVQAIKIANIINNKGDDRYGDVDSKHEFISTGASYAFTTSELANVQLGNLVNVTLDVWGGDCFVAPHTFKISDSTYSVTNVTKGNSPPVTEDLSLLLTKWGKYFRDSRSIAMSLPVAIEAAAQFVTVILESEYNGGVMAEDGMIDDGSVNNMPVPISSGNENLRSPLTYRYNINLSKENDEKVYFSRPKFNFEKSVFPSRIIYSDQKIYNTDKVGFDVFRVLNFLDLEEKYGEITKLALESDNLYAIQEKATIALPVGETQITTTDAGQLSVGTSDFFGRPIPIDTNRGSQHLRSVVETGQGVYIIDNANRGVYLLSGNILTTISGINNTTLFRSLLPISQVGERNLWGIYDQSRRQYWASSPVFCYLFNENRKQWVGALEVSALKAGVHTNSKLFLIGKVGNQVGVYTMYEGNANDLFGTTVVPRVSFVVNPDDAISKIFTNQAFIATQRLATVDYVLEREQELGNLSVSGTILDTSNIRENSNYRLKLPRDGFGARLRGLRLLCTVKWKTTNLFSSLSSVLTKYRHESRTPF